MGVILREYRGAGRFLGALRKYLIAAGLVFALFTGISWAVTASNPVVAGEAMQKVVGIFDAKDLYETPPEDVRFDGDGPELRLNTPKLIFNNLFAMAYCVILGFLPFLCLPVFPLVMNAMIIGLMGGAMGLGGMGFGVFAGALAPHGIFELPAFVISCAMGFYLSWGLARKIFRSRKARRFGEIMKDILRTYGLVVLPLTVIAGVMESYVTPLVMERLISAM